jgi:hypothetical protein
MPDSALDTRVNLWRTFISRRDAGPADASDREPALRRHAAALGETGLSPDEAFLVAAARVAGDDALSREFVRTYTDRLWKGPVARTAAASAARTRREAIVAFVLAIAAAAAIKAPELFGRHIEGPDGLAMFYARNLSLFVLPLLAGYFAWKRGLGAAGRAWLAAPFAAAAVAVNVFPFTANSDTETLAALHLPIALWLAVGVAHARNRWFAENAPMNFVRFSGDLAISYVLIALGGGVFIGFTAMMFAAIGIRPDALIGHWILPCGATGALIIASWLVETRQAVLESMAPVLTRIFTPLFTLLLLAFLGTMAWTGHPIDVKREILIGFDLLLALVVGLVLYAAASRAPGAPPAFFDRLQFLLVVSALAVDGVALAAIGARISEFGFTANRVAALGENLILLVNLTWTARLYVPFIFGRGKFAAVERWQTTYLPVYSLWAAVVVVLFPPLFGYR